MNQKSSWIKFIVVWTELAFCILSGIFLGGEADKYFNKQPLFTILGVIIGSIAGFTLMLKVLNKRD